MYIPRSSLTSTLFESPNVQFFTDPVTKNRSVVAKNNIKMGELLISEHVFKGSSQELCNMIQKNSYFFNSLYPRTLEWSEKNSSEQADLGQEKITFNCFMLERDLDMQSLVLGDKISYFNHYCDSNACPTFHTIETNICDIVIMSVVAMKDVKCDEEIFINYGTKHGHTDSFNYKCNCGINEEVIRETIKRDQSKAAHNLVNKNNLEKRTQHYFKSPKIIFTVLVRASRRLLRRCATRETLICHCYQRLMRSSRCFCSTFS
jgi:hypothetical protein